MEMFFCFVFHITAFLWLHYRPKSLNFRMANSNVQKTFWAKSLKSFCDKKVCVNCLQFQDSQEYFQTVLKFSRLSRNFPNHLENIRKLSRSSGNFRPSGKYPDYMETFQAIHKLSRPSRKYPDYPETFQTIWKSSRLSKDFPEGPEPSQCNFKGYAQ